MADDRRAESVVALAGLPEGSPRHSLVEMSGRQVCAVLPDLNPPENCVCKAIPFQNGIQRRPGKPPFNHPADDIRRNLTLAVLCVEMRRRIKPAGLRLHRFGATLVLDGAAACVLSSGSGARSSPTQPSAGAAGASRLRGADGDWNPAAHRSVVGTPHPAGRGYPTCEKRNPCCWRKSR